MIVNEGPLTEGEVKDIENMRNTELFRVVRKLCSHEYSKLAEYMSGELTPNDIQVVRGMMKGIKMVYGLLLANAKLSYYDGKLHAENADPLPGSKKLRNMREQEEIR